MAMLNNKPETRAKLIPSKNYCAIWINAPYSLVFKIFKFVTWESSQIGGIKND
jgi:hypothetical protein